MKLEIKEVSKSYGQIKALDKVSLNLTKGIYALLGPNGSGKSTLMNIITDNLKSDNGEILFDNKPTKELGVKFRERVGFMPQYPGMYQNFSIEHFMNYMSVLKGLDQKTAKEQIEKILDEVELLDVKHRKINALSGGMKQRLGLAQAVLGEPEILILDEPTAGLDPKQRIAIRNYISRISLNKIVLIATHVVADVEYIAKEIIILKKGVIIDDAKPEELVKSITDKVWNVSITNEQVMEFQNKYKVVNIQNTGNNITLRILSDTKPNELSKNTQPTLEDYYLYIFGDETNIK